MKGRVGRRARQALGVLMIASSLATVFILTNAPAGYRAVAFCGAAIIVFFVIGYELLHPEVRDPVLDELELYRREANLMASALEEIGHFGIGRAGVVARDALVEVGIWRDGVERREAPVPITMAFQRLGWAGPFKHAVHDPPIGPYLADSILDGTWTFVVPVTVDDSADRTRRLRELSESVAARNERIAR